jgi:hypothetical protein
MRFFYLIVTLLLQFPLRSLLRLSRYPARRAPHFSAQTLIIRDASRTVRRVLLRVLAQPRCVGAREGRLMRRQRAPRRREVRLRCPL